MLEVAVWLFFTSVIAYVGYLEFSKYIAARTAAQNQMWTYGILGVTYAAGLGYLYNDYLTSRLNSLDSKFRDLQNKEDCGLDLGLDVVMKHPRQNVYPQVRNVFDNWDIPCTKTCVRFANGTGGCPTCPTCPTGTTGTTKQGPTVTRVPITPVSQVSTTGQVDIPPRSDSPFGDDA
jgi:hypothetical protein